MSGSRVTIVLAVLTCVPAASAAQSWSAADAPYVDQDRTSAARDRADAERTRAEAQRVAERARSDADRARAEAQRSRDRERRDYERAHEALEDAEWSSAASLFQSVVTAGGSRADGALYWKAYALDKLGQRAEALTAIAELSRSFPKSRWIGDARALEVQVRQRVGQPVVLSPSGDDELKLLALNALGAVVSDDAVVVLKQVLESTQSLKLKERALFVLAQSASPEARRLMAEIARQANPDLQRKAIDYLGVHGSNENRVILQEVYRASSDPDVKRRVLRAYMVSGDRVRVLSAASSEANAELRAEAVRQLGVMGAHDELWQLYGKESTVDVKRDILQAMFVGGNATRLIELAKTEANPDLRRTAVRNLGLMRSSATGPALVEIYGAQSTPEVKVAVVNGLFVQNNADALVGLARKESDPTLKRELVQKISLMKSKVARDYLMELLGK
jgi:tetratricopeptide (TPR) repeat protein